MRCAASTSNPPRCVRLLSCELEELCEPACDDLVGSLIGNSGDDIAAVVRDLDRCEVAVEILVTRQTPTPKRKREENDERACETTK